MEFGISLDPLAVVQRHALYDSESDEESEQQPQESSEVFTFDGRGKRGDILKGKTLLVAVGGSASVFVRSFVRLREEPLLSLQADVGRVEKGSHFPKGNAIKEITVFRDTEENTELLICTHPTELTIEFCNKWTEKVFGQGKPHQVVIFVCRSLHEYFNPSVCNDDRTHVMRGLQSSSWPHPHLNVMLEPPNSIQGETAAVLTHCELQGIPCLVHILYASSSLTEREKAVLFLHALNETMATLKITLPIRGEEEGEMQVMKLQPRGRTDLANLYT